MGIGVGERSQSVVIFLTSGIPKSELDVLSIDFDVGNIVLEDGGDVDLYGLRQVSADMSCFANGGHVLKTAQELLIATAKRPCEGDKAMNEPLGKYPWRRR